MKFFKFGAFSLLGFIFLIGGLRFLSPPLKDNISLSREVYDRTDRLLRLTLSGDEKYRIWTPLQEVNPQYIESVLLYEDQYFFYHPGVNPVSLVKAAMFYRKGGKNPGASTLTMQLARLKYGLKTQSFKGKVFQIIQALRLEAQYSKKEILEAYINLVPFGGPLEGIGSASQIFFSKKPKDLSLSESLLLTLIPQDPTQRGLLKQTNKNKALKNSFKKLKQKWVSTRPKDDSFITFLELPNLKTKIKALPFTAPHFTNMVLNNSSKLLVHSTLNSSIQRLIEKKTHSYVQSKHSVGVNNAAVLVIHHESNEVLAYMGSNDFFNEEIQGQVDGVQAKRSPGSTLKPFVYALAFDQGLIHPKTLLKDTPYMFANYNPENFDQKFLGPLHAEKALQLSRNIPAVTLSQKISQPNLFEFLKKAHIHFPYDENHYGLSLVLGGTEISPWEMGHLYSLLANFGRWQPLKWELSAPAANPSTLLSQESSFVILDILRQMQKPQQNYRSDWLLEDIPIAWKTGTSPGFRDAWTAGVVGPYTVVVWLGNFDNTSNHAFVGVELAAPLFFQIVDGIIEDQHSQPLWNDSTGLALTKADVCSSSGHLPHEFCPHKTAVWFRPGVSPITTCDIHRQVHVHKDSGLRSCRGTASQTELKVFEFWPSDLQQLFAQAGIRRKSPPAFSPECRMNLTVNYGKKPQIISPKPGQTYLRSLTASKEKNTLPLEAIADSDSSELYWFVGTKFIGKTKSQQTLHYKNISAGPHTFIVIDDLGRSDSVTAELQVVR